MLNLWFILIDGLMDLIEKKIFKKLNYNVQIIELLVNVRNI